MKLYDHLLGEVLEFHDSVRVPLSGAERETRKGSYRYYGAQGVIDHIDGFLFDGQFILIAEDGANLVTRNEPIAFLVGGQFWVNNHAHVVKGIEGLADEYYLTSLLNHLNIAGFITGAAQPKLSQQNLRLIPVKLPHYENQQAIASILSAYDEAMENNRRRMGLLERAVRLLYEEWFVRLRFPGHEHTPITHGLPQGWERKPLNAICPDLREAANPADLESGTPYIGLEHMPRRSITLLEWGTAEDVTSTKLRYLAGDILFGKIRPYFHKVGFALTDGVTSSDAIVLRPSEPLYYIFSLLTVSSQWFVNIASKTAKEGSKMPRADWNLMETHMLAIPPHSLLESLNETVLPILNQLRTLAIQNQKLRTARELLLPRLMSGEMEV